MALFDFVESAADGYRFLMREHAVVGQLALVPLLIKLASFILITAVDMQENILRQGLVLIPSYFAEGWLVVRLIRIALFNDYGMAALSGNRTIDLINLSARARTIASATIIYVLIKLVLAFISGIAWEARAAEGAIAPAAPSAETFLIGMLAMLFMVWAFRFLWLYVPAAMGYSVTDFLRRIQPLQTSFHFIGTWLLCFMPVALILIVASEVLTSLFPVAEGAEPAAISVYLLVSVQAVLELVATIVSSIAIAYGVQHIYKPKK